MELPIFEKETVRKITDAIIGKNITMSVVIAYNFEGNIFALAESRYDDYKELMPSYMDRFGKILTAVSMIKREYERELYCQPECDLMSIKSHYKNGTLDRELEKLCDVMKVADSPFKYDQETNALFFKWRNVGGIETYISTLPELVISTSGYIMETTVLPSEIADFITNWYLNHREELNL